MNWKWNLPTINGVGFRPDCDVAHHVNNFSYISDLRFVVYSVVFYSYIRIFIVYMM